MTAEPPLVVVSGMPASGKSTLAAALGVPWIEVDTTRGPDPSIDAIVAWVEDHI